MTVPDPTVPTAKDVIAETLAREFGAFLAPPGPAKPHVFWHSQAAAVVAAMRAMTVEQQAQLIGGEVERQARLSSGKPISLSTPLGLQIAQRMARSIEARLVGPWQETP